MSRTDKLIASLLCGIMGAFGGGMFPLMLDAGTWWIAGGSVVGFLFVTVCAFGFGLKLSARLTKISDASAMGAFMFDPAGGFVPCAVGGAILGLMLGILEMSAWPIAFGLILGVGLGVFHGVLALLWRAVFQRDSSSDNSDPE